MNRLSKKFVLDTAAKRFDQINWTCSGRYAKTALYLGGKHYSVCRHVLVYYMDTGKIVDKVDHIDGNTFNDVPSNLREATQLQNCHNRRINSNNTSGVKGVHKDARGKFVARIRVGDGKRIYVGSFDNLEDAEAAIKVARKIYHGEYANNG